MLCDANAMPTVYVKCDTEFENVFTEFLRTLKSSKSPDLRIHNATEVDLIKLAREPESDPAVICCDQTDISKILESLSESAIHIDSKDGNDLEKSYKQHILSYLRKMKPGNNVDIDWEMFSCVGPIKFPRHVPRELGMMILPSSLYPILFIRNVYIMYPIYELLVELIELLDHQDSQQKSGISNGIHPSQKFVDESTYTNGIMQLSSSHFRLDPVGDLKWIIESKPALSHHVKHAIRTIEVCIAQYGVEHIGLSFNGGKDCTVLLHLFEAVLRVSGPGTPRKKIKTLYVMPSDPFEEVEEFIDDCVERYNLDLERIRAPMKDALQEFLNQNTNIKAILIGTRSTDPFSSHLKDMNPTDNGWPSVMRVHPILDWAYADIWAFLRCVSVPYCVLYDIGYTSIGGIHNTKPNPALANQTKTSGFDPAYKLIDGEKERDGRM